MLQGLGARLADAASSAADGLLGGQPYAARLARASVKAGYLHGLGENHQWKRRFFVLKPTTMLYYFGSDADEEPLGCVDVEAFTSVSCREVHQDGRVTIELARAAPPGADNAKPLIFSLRAPGESEGRCVARTEAGDEASCTFPVRVTAAAVALTCPDAITTACAGPTTRA